MLHDVRTILLDEAQRSPALLSDLAGLEEYIAESYDSRSFVEMLQNADDAKATRFCSRSIDGLLIAANDGCQFTKQDFESLCRSAASAKARGECIGYRGIGFKSVVSLARKVHLVSGELAATFCRERTRAAIPGATRVPLIRIPHQLDPSDRSRFAQHLKTLFADGFTTVFVFEDLDSNRIANEFDAFDPTALLFLRSVRRVEVTGFASRLINVDRRQKSHSTRRVSLADADSHTEWLLNDGYGITIASQIVDENPVRLTERDALVHAFLPTLETTGLGAKVNGDFSTDPSRTRVVLDDRTRTQLTAVSRLLVDLVEAAILQTASPADVRLANSIVPSTDARLAAFQRRSFKTELLSIVEKVGVPRFSGLRLRPEWLNGADFSKLANASGLRTISSSIDSTDCLDVFLRFVGANDASLADLSGAIASTSFTDLGAAELVAVLSQQFSVRQIEIADIRANWRLWSVGGKLLSFSQAKTSKQPLDSNFINLLDEKARGITEVRRLVAAIGDQETADILLPLAATQNDVKTTELPFADSLIRVNSSDKRPPLKKWRSAEQQVLAWFDSLGWTVKDVSRQNVGYDVEAITPDGSTFFIETKSIDYSGQPFTLTSNEEAVARLKGDSYIIAIACQSNEFLDVGLIRNPIENVVLTRQCRQWVWECSSYSFTPERIPLE